MTFQTIANGDTVKMSFPTNGAGVSWTRSANDTFTGCGFVHHAANDAVWGRTVDDLKAARDGAPSTVITAPPGAEIIIGVTDDTIGVIVMWGAVVVSTVAASTSTVRVIMA